MNSEFSNWLSLSGEVTEGQDTQTLACPSCGQHAVDFRFVGRVSDRIGYLDVWCRSCLRGIHISRMKVPQERPMLNLDRPLDRAASGIPSFSQVLPD